MGVMFQFVFLTLQIIFFFDSLFQLFFSCFSNVQNSLSFIIVI